MTHWPNVLMLVTQRSAHPSSSSSSLKTNYFYDLVSNTFSDTARYEQIYTH